MQLEPSGHWIESPIDFGYANDFEVQSLEPLPPAVPMEALEPPVENQQLPSNDSRQSVSTSPSTQTQTITVSQLQRASPQASSATKASAMERIVRPFVELADTLTFRRN